MKFLNFLILVAIVFSSCKNNNKQPEPLPSNSIFHLNSNWQNQHGDSLHLKDLQGKTLVVVMIYTTCKSACPVLVAKMKNIESKIDKENIAKTSLVLVSIDPESDTPARLKEFANINQMDGPQWVFLTSNMSATQEFANVLSMKYKKISPLDFSHSNIISVFNPEGQLVSQEEGLEINVEKVSAIVNKTVKESLD